MFHLDQLAELSPLNLSIAQYIMSYPEKVAYMRIRELAESTHSSPSSIIRFTQKVGFNSFPELRLHIRDYVANQEKILTTEAYNETLLNKVNQPDTIDSSIKQLVTMINEAELIHCIGLGASGAIAEYASSHLNTLGYFTFVSKGTYFPYATLNDSNKNRAKELCLFFSVSGETIELTRMLSLLEEKNTRTISITANQDSYLAKHADLNITYETSYNRIHFNADLSSQLPVVFIIESLIKEIVSQHSNN